MPLPQHVKARFTESVVIFENGEFSIAVGNYRDEATQEVKQSVGMRWNGDYKAASKGGDPGYPLKVTTPVWFIIHDDLVLPILRTLPGETGTKAKGIFEALDRFKTRI